VQREPTTSSIGDYGEENGSDKEQSEKGSDDRDCDMDDGEESNDAGGEHGIRAAPSSAGVTFEEPEAVELMAGDMSGGSLSLEEEGEDDKVRFRPSTRELYIYIYLSIILRFLHFSPVKKYASRTCYSVNSCISFDCRRCLVSRLHCFPLHYFGICNIDGFHCLFEYKCVNK
jgi:hypothetical protein